MKLVSLSDYAEMHDVSHQAAGKWKRDGALVMNGELVDVERSDAKMKGVGLGRFRVSAHGGRRKKGERGVVDRPGVKPSLPPKIVHAERRFQTEMVAFRAAEPLGIAVHIEREMARLDTAARQGQPLDFSGLVEQAEVVMLWELNELRETVGWLEWAERVAPAIAADLGMAAKSEALAKALVNHVREHLEGDPMFRDIENASATLAKMPAE